MEKSNFLLMNAEETSIRIFNRQRSPWSLLQDAKKKRLPCLHIGTRVFFELNTLTQYLDKQLSKSIEQPSEEYDGIRKID